MKKVELLAPAGNFEALKGALQAGADAVYLGGALYGARAYAENFTQDEICTGIRLAHAFGRKIYLTVNTLVKEKELDRLYDFLLPVCESGLDGVIVQDMGVLRYIRSHFPEVNLHASTQMTITGSYGAKLLQSEGVSRIVPARELSLKEIVRIREETGIEIEAFIHGAMCYCYSGQCLFSSILGGRSGNRGRCAQPCRLPYRIDGQKSCYPLSMRDMCTLSVLPRLIEAGIDSFKIEGRMKKSAYAAGVTALYRKYIDLYYKDRDAWKVQEADLTLLKSLYIRSQTGEGYYFRQKGKELLSLESPAYCPVDEKVLREIENKYVKKPLTRSAYAEAEFKTGQRARLTLSCGDVTVSCEGAVVQPARTRPLSQEKIREQILKSGNTWIQMEQVRIIQEEAGIFLPISDLNKLRRDTVAALTQALVGAYTPERVQNKEKQPACQGEEKSEKKEKKGEIHVCVSTWDQFDAAVKKKVSRIYVEYTLATDPKRPVKEVFRKAGAETELYLAGPRIVRYKERSVLDMLLKLAKNFPIKGILIRNLESLAYFRECGLKTNYVADHNLYLWNRESVAFFENYGAAEFCLPLECNRREWKELLTRCSQTIRVSALAYGRIPMMVSAGCVEKTRGGCIHKTGWNMLTDRYGKHFPVYHDCFCCCNVIYNSVPLVLQNIFADMKGMLDHFRLDFTAEPANETEEILEYFSGLRQGSREDFRGEYTTGHYKRGVE